jgi:hypothetical protein
LGLLSEDLIEREHHVDRIYNERHGNVKDFEVKSKGMEANIARATAPAVAAKVDEVSEGRKRGPYEPRMKTVEAKKAKQEQRSKVMDIDDNK